ncbi:hypothetical protein QTP88_015892 [Uroleucon formosanum]
MTLVQSLGLIEEAEKCIEQVQGPLGVAVKEKMHSVLHKNPGLDCLKLIRDAHCEMNGVIFPAELTALDIANMKFAPITSVEVERSFSRYKSVLRPNRRSFNFENLSIPTNDVEYDLDWNNACKDVLDENDSDELTKLLQQFDEFDTPIDSSVINIPKNLLWDATRRAIHYNMSSKPFDIVMRLLDNVTESNRNLTCDNWYTSYSLATELLKKQTTIVGTLRKNKKEIPVDFQPHKNKSINSSFFGFQKEIMITSYTPKKNKAVILLSTMHNDTSVNSETKKPEVIHFYNSTKGGVDTVDQMCGNYSVSRRTRRWPLSIFFQLLNIAGINANILYNNTQIEKKHKNRRSFLKSLSMNLMNNHLSERSQMTNLPTDIKHFLSKYETKEVDVQEPPTKIRSRCYLCGRAKNRVTTIQCSSCQKFTCKEHVKAVFIGTGQRKIIVNLYKKIVKHQLENPDSPRMTLREMIVDISKSSGIGQRSVQNILSEYKNQGTITSPNKKKIRPTIIEKIDEFDKNAKDRKYTIFGGTAKYQQSIKC